MYIVYAVYGKNSESSNIIYSGTPYTVTYGNIHETLSFDGTTSFSDSQKLTFWQQWLKVTQVLVNLGDKVKKDQVLATLESTDVDASFKTAQSNLTLAKLNYEKIVWLHDKDSDLLKAQNDLITAENNLQNIETTITLTNQEEDNNIAKATQSLKDAKEDYEDLVCNDCSNSDEKLRNQRNTYKAAIEDLRTIANTAQSTLNSLDMIMYFSSTYQNTAWSNEASAYIGYNDKSSITTTRNSFSSASTLLDTLENTYSILSSKNSDAITFSEIKDAYNQVDKLSQNLMTLGNNARTMFNASLVWWWIAGQSSSLSQSDVDNYISLANTIYTSWKSLNSQGTSTMEKIYNLDNNSTESTISKAKEALDSAQLNLDKLLLSKNNRINNNQIQRTQAQVAVNTAQLNIKAIQEWYFDTSVQSAHNQLVQAQASADQIRKRYESYQLIANFDGTVREMNIQVGDTVNTESNTYIYVENPNLIETTLELDQLDILKIERGDEATVTLDILKNQSFSGVVSAVNTIPTTRNNKTIYTVKVLSERPQDLSLVGGMSANVTFTKYTQQHVLVIPTTALSREQGKYFVMGEDNIKHEVVVWGSDTSFSEVVSGLKLGDRILSLAISQGQMENAGISSKVFNPNENPFEEGWSAGLRNSRPSRNNYSNN